MRIKRFFVEILTAAISAAVIVFLVVACWMPEVLEPNGLAMEIGRAIGTMLVGISSLVFLMALGEAVWVQVFGGAKVSDEDANKEQDTKAAGDEATVPPEPAEVVPTPRPDALPLRGTRVAILTLLFSALSWFGIAYFHFEPPRAVGTMEHAATHEAGHAAVIALMFGPGSVKVVRLYARGRVLGENFLNANLNDGNLIGRERWMARQMVHYGGVVAETVLYGGDVTIGSGGDLQQAADRAEKMVTTLGMSERIGLRAYVPGHKDYDKDVEVLVKAEKHRILLEAIDRTRDLIEKNRGLVAAIAKALLVSGRLSGKEVDAIVAEHLRRVPGT